MTKSKSPEVRAPKGREEMAAGFSANQLRKLLRPVDPRRVQSREIEGRRLSYIEGWYAITQANEVFGYAGWDRETVHFERVLERSQGDQIVCGYVARVRIRVRAGTSPIVREGTGWGCATARTLANAHERALKSAETDATKRALSTFGPSFGLSLYDKDANGNLARGPRLVLLAPDGKTIAGDLSPEGFSTGLRQLIELCDRGQEIENLRAYNSDSIVQLKSIAPSLRNAQGTHFADLLLKLLEKARRRLTRPSVEGSEIAVPSTETPQEDFRRHIGQASRRRTEVMASPVVPVALPASPITLPEQSGSQSAAIDHDQKLESLTAGLLPEPPEQVIVMKKSATGAATMPAIKAPEADKPDSGEADVTALPPSRIALGSRIDKASLAIGYERRHRDKDHLRRVAQLPCLICSRQPSHAHHLRFAQRRGLSQKVSDGYVVPLCALHHGDLHRSSSEKDWWRRQNIDPLPVSSQLWETNH